jgi:hypothetical protein
MLEYKLFYEEKHELPTLEGLTPYWCDEDKKSLTALCLCNSA